MKAISKKLSKKIYAAPFIQKATEDYEKLLENLPKAVDIVFKINKRFPELGVSPSACGCKYTGYISLSSLDSFKDQKLVDILEFLNNLNPISANSSKYPAGYNIDYKFDFDCILISVFAYVKSDSDVCRRVVVGEETVTQYKYDLICDEDIKI